MIHMPHKCNNCTFQHHTEISNNVVFNVVGIASTPRAGHVIALLRYSSGCFMNFPLQVHNVMTSSHAGSAALP